MPKDNTEKDDSTGDSKSRKDERETDKKSRDDEGKASDSSNELEPVQTKKGEPSDNLRRRGEWFQKRRSG